MLFNSIEFLFFFIIVLFLYFIIDNRLRWLLLLISSYYFYMSWKPEYVILILFTTLVNYYCALKIDEIKNLKAKKFYFISSILISLSLLFTFKYFNFFSNSLSDFLNLFSIQFDPFLLNFLLPVGISFYTFQSISYTIDVYTKKIKPEKHLGIFALYVSFFPQLVAGPIERAKHLLPQFRKKHYFKYDDVVLGLKLMLWGFFMKVVIADKLSPIVDIVYNNVTVYTGLPLILATYFFAFQILGDFAGYSLIAIGSAKIMGYDLMQNFRQPYFAKSIGDFWKRWNISLSTWFKDYVYIPMGGSRVKVQRWYFNLIIVFLISGLWHGANWTFIIWGGLHGFYLVFSIFIRNFRMKFSNFFNLSKFNILHNFLKILITFHLVLFSWIFFRANSIEDALYIINNLFVNFSLDISQAGLGTGWFGMIYYFFIILFLLFVEFILDNVKFQNFLLKFSNPWTQRFLFIGLILWLLLFGVFDKTQFIYFQF